MPKTEVVRERRQPLETIIRGKDLLYAGAIDRMYKFANIFPDGPFNDIVRKFSASPATTIAYFMRKKEKTPIPYVLYLTRRRWFPDKDGLEKMVSREFLDFSKIEVLANPRLRCYPDLPHIPYDGLGYPNVLARWYNAIKSRNPIYGFPSFTVSRNGFGEDSNWDTDFMGRFYSGSEEKHKVYYSVLKDVFDSVLNSKVFDPEHPERSDREYKKALDRLRFLGLGNEEEFIKKTEEVLLSEIEFSGLNTGRIKTVMAFSKATDAIREKYGMELIERFKYRLSEEEIKEMIEDYQLTKGKRRTGESYYCHYLASAWFLWQMIKQEVEEGKINTSDAETLIEVMFKHDLMEDLDARFEDGKLVIDIGPDPISIGVTSKEIEVIDELTKKDDKGVSWFEDQIFGIQDPVLRCDLARCKSADRLPSLLTMSLSPGRSYLKILRKIAETIFTGGQLLLTASDLDMHHPLIADEQISQADINSFLMYVASIPIIAQMEYFILQQRFTRKIIDEVYWSSLRPDLPESHIAGELYRLYSSYEDMNYNELMQELNSQKWHDNLLAHFQPFFTYQDENGHDHYRMPLWMPRLAGLGKHYGMNYWKLYSAIPQDSLPDIFGLKRFGLMLEREKRDRPISLNDIYTELVSRPMIFFRQMDVLRGPVLGSDVWISNYRNRPEEDYRLAEYSDFLFARR